MRKIVFRDVAHLEKIKIYRVSRGGAIDVYMTNPKNLHFGDEFGLDDSSIHLNKNGNIYIGWSYALFLNAEDAAELATRIATTKYNNAIEKIKKITNI